MEENVVIEGSKLFADIPKNTKIKNSRLSKILQGKTYLVSIFFFIFGRIRFYFHFLKENFKQKE